MTSHREVDAARGQLFEKLFHENFLYVCACVRRFGVRPSDVEDIAHEVFLTVYRRLDSYTDDRRGPRAWLAKIAYFTACSARQLRSHREVPFAESAPEPFDATPPADRLLELEEERSLVLEALDALPDERRVVFAMHDIDELAPADIAAALSIPVNTVYSRLRTARTEFRDAVVRLVQRRSSDQSGARVRLAKGMAG